ncbi:hypothetical protein ACLB2K_034319 [Fragaria x ananassa]
MLTVSGHRATSVPIVNSITSPNDTIYDSYDFQTLLGHQFKVSRLAGDDLGRQFKVSRSPSLWSPASSYWLSVIHQLCHST